MKLNEIFTDGMILQAHKNIRLYGKGSGKITVSIADITKTAEFSTDDWILELPALSYGGPYEMTVDLNGELVTIKDIYIGEVVFLGGQSNMAMSLGGTSYPKENYEDNDLVRMYTAAPFEGDGEYKGKFRPKDGWVKCDKETAPHFSAIGYHIGTELSREKKIAVGLISCALGSTVIESWMPACISSQERFYLPKEEKYDSPFVHGPYNAHGILYKVRQQSVVPYRLGNIVWYQGESNTGSGEWKIYTALLAELIKCWRKDFMDDNLPFVVVQIADWDVRDDDAWHGIQKAQEKIVEYVDNVCVVKSADVCETHDIHPPTKINLAKRIINVLK